MKTGFISNVGLLLLAVVFSTGLFFAFIELPALLDNLMQNQLGFPQFDHGGSPMNALKTEMFIQGLHLRWIGYGSLLLILGLIVLGYSTRKSGWALAGAIGLFIPIFGQFALSMFFLAGLGLLRVGWLPFLEVSSFDLLDLGKVIYVPYWVLIWLFGLFKWNAHTFLSYFFMASGAFLFTWGVLLWFKSRYRKQQVASSWIYKISRHPQYLGWILWSYGFMLFTPFLNNMKKSWSVPTSLPWLLMCMTIIGICMMEELRMMRVTDGKYQEYRESAPFLFPLPRWLNRILTWPGRMIGKGSYPTKGSQVIWITLIYTLIFMLLSLPWVDIRKEKPVKEVNQSTLAGLGEIMRDIRENENERRIVWEKSNQLTEYGTAGLDSLLVLAKEKNPLAREFSMQLLADHDVKELESILINNMYDSINRVRMAAIQSAGKIKSELAVDTLIQLLGYERTSNNRWLIYNALGEIGNPKAIPGLAGGLEGGAHYEQISALDAIFKIDSAAGVTYAIMELQDNDVNVRRNAVMTCILSEDPIIVEHLEKMHDDEDFEVRFYAKQGLKQIKREAAYLNIH